MLLEVFMPGTSARWQPPSRSRNILPKNDLHSCTREVGSDLETVRVTRVAVEDAVVSQIELPKGESDTNLAVAIGRAVDGYPYYTVFDYIDATIKNGVVTLIGYVTPDMNKSQDLADAVAKVRGVQEVPNQIVTLPVS